jgi:hypothetical protein
MFFVFLIHLYDSRLNQNLIERAEINEIANDLGEAYPLLTAYVVLEGYYKRNTFYNKHKNNLTPFKILDPLVHTNPNVLPSIDIKSLGFETLLKILSKVEFDDVDMNNSSFSKIQQQCLINIVWDPTNVLLPADPTQEAIQNLEQIKTTSKIEAQKFLFV